MQEKISTYVPKSVHAIMKTLHAEGYLVFIVGGFIRDALLGKKPKDLDLVTDADSATLIRIFGRKARQVGRRFPIVHVYASGSQVVEVSSFAKQHWSKKWFSSQSQQKNELLLHDARRRDFTVNAMYAEYPSYQIHDPLHGRKALDNRLLQMIGNMPARYVEDPVRFIRAIRFQAKLEFKQQKGFFSVFQKKKKLIQKVSDQRLFLEFLKLMQTDHAVNSLHYLLHYQLVSLFFPVRDQDIKYLNIFLEQYEGLRKQGKYQSTSLLIAGLLWPLVSEKVGVVPGPQQRMGVIEYFSYLLAKEMQLPIPRKLQELVSGIWVMLIFLQSQPFSVERLSQMPGYEKAEFISSALKQAQLLNKSCE